MKKILLSIVSTSALACTLYGAKVQAQTLNNIEISSSRELKIQNLNTVLNDYLGKKISARLLQDLLNELSAFYQKQGYLAARAYFPEQESTNGVLKVVIESARLNEIIIENQSNCSNGTVYKLLNAVRHEQNKDISSKTINNHLLKVQDLNVFDISGYFSNNADDMVDLTLNLQNKHPVSYEIFYDNYGTKNSGKNRLVGIFNTDNLFKSADKFSFYASSTEKKQQNYGFDFKLPVDSNLDVLGLSFSYGLYDLSGEYKDLKANGSVYNFDPYFVSLLYIDENYRLKAKINPYYKSMQDNLDAFDVRLKRHTYGSRFSLGFDALSEKVSVFNNLTLNYGRLKNDDDYNLYEDKSYTIFNFENMVSVPLPYDLTLTNTLNIQYANTSVDASDKFMLGGAYAVKAYQSNIASADIGLFDDLKVQSRINTYSNVYVNLMQSHAKNVNSKKESLYGFGIGSNFNYEGFYLNPSVNIPFGKNKKFAENSTTLLIKFGYSSL